MTSETNPQHNSYGLELATYLNNADDKIREAWHYLTETNEPIFITGNAGTGKTTLIKNFLAYTTKKYAVLAPTGVAAINAGGQTIHSFYGFRVGALAYDKIKNLDNDFKARKMHDACDGIIIDESSMVRADLMDYIEWFYHKNYPNKRDCPFAGKRIILVGDLDQLPPVVSSDEERKFIQDTYGNEFFFAAKCWKKTSIKIIKLEKVYRQSDPVFVGLLNDVKRNKITDEAIGSLNSACLKTKLTKNDGIVLATTNETAQNLNVRMVARLEGQSIILKGKAEGDFNEKNLPVEPNIEIKIGARVMMAVNDYIEKPRRYVNGSMGIVVAYEEGSVELPSKGKNNGWLDEPTMYEGMILKVQLDTGEEIDVPPFTFEQLKYEYDEKEKKLTERVISSFTQYPIKLAYAITIHKSQGLTFDKVIIDLGNGAFAHGQLYVALSRCRSMEGISLRVPIRREDLIFNEHVTAFNSNL